VIRLHDLGMVPYREAWRLQEDLRTQRLRDAIPDTLLLCEHPPVFTVGRQDCRADWRASFETIRAAGIDVVESNRGGRITYHGPGQIVGYWIVDLRARDCGIRDFVRKIEQILIDAVATFGVTAARDPINPGIWVGPDKLGAIGLHVRGGVTQHGFALNHTTALADYQYIIPCGLADRGVTTLERLLGDSTPIRAACCAAFHTAITRVLQVQLVAVGSVTASTPALSAEAASKVGASLDAATTGSFPTS
jgi:lipoyl(octanoyl) transferase